MHLYYYVRHLRDEPVQNDNLIILTPNLKPFFINYLIFQVIYNIKAIRRLTYYQALI